ncbi:sensor histidine kinase [Streptomyces vinaceus]|uniref:sensor histidine kinase n=1 Tax=Streptomyces vinaceus TaxID=1960 RepID=UPI00380B197E
MRITDIFSPHPDGQDRARTRAPDGGGRPARTSAVLLRLLRPVAPARPAADDSSAVAIVLEAHQRRATRIQAVLRGVVVAAVMLDLALYPPFQNPGTSIAIASLYGIWSVLQVRAAWRGRLAEHTAWAVLYADLPALLVILTVSGTFSDPTWSSPFAGDAFILIPVLAAFQLRPRITAAAGAAAAVAYAVAAGAGHLHANPDLHFALTHALFIALVGTACVLLSQVQQSRVQMISSLAAQRSWMISRSAAVSDRERRLAADVLHDGALQCVLAARHDIEEAMEDEAARAETKLVLERADGALQDASRHLRSSVSELHPSVLEQAGVAQALEDLAHRAVQRGGMTLHFRADAPTAGRVLDRLLFSCGRELVVNAVKHARAEHLTVRLDLQGSGDALLVVADDGVGLPAQGLERRLAEGHIGLASLRVRVEDFGGTLEFSPNDPAGTVAVVRIPKGLWSTAG